ncbi:MAG: phosphate ABC transporter substrate-binding protein [Gammaproteobacteria bacterium]
MMRKSKRLWWIGGLILPLVLGAVSVPASAGITVVVSAGNGMTSLTAHQVKLLFMKKRRRFPDGNTAVPIDQAENSAIYRKFANQVLRKDPAQLKAYWSVQVFSGTGSPPKQVHGDRAVKALVSGSPYAIGYIDSASVDDSVKVVFAVGK